MPNEVQAQVDFIARKYQETLKGFSDISEQFKILKEEISRIFPQLASYKDFQLKMTEFCETITKKTLDISTVSKATHDNSNLLLSDLSKSFDDLKKDSISFKVLFEDVKGRFDKLEKAQLTFAPSSSIGRLENDHKELIQDIEKMNKCIISSQQSFADNHHSLRKSVEELQNDLKASKKKIDDLFGLFTSLSVEHSALKEKVAREIKSLRDYFEEYVKAQISSIPKPIIPSIDEAKSAFKSHLEPVILAAKNSLIRSQNNESKIVLLEKKVEQLQLLLNKYHLQDQK